MGKFLFWMHASEDTEEIPIECRGVRDTRVAEQGREHRSESDPQDHRGGKARRGRAVKLFHERADDERRVLRLLPWKHAKDAGLHGQIQNGDADNGNKNPARNIASGVANFTAQMANVVIAPIRVDGVDGRGAEGSKE